MVVSEQQRANVEKEALDFYRQHEGRLFRCWYLCGYEDDDSTDIACDVIVKVRETLEGDVLHWNDEWLDPYWDVDVIRVISGDVGHIRSTWIDGPSINAITGERQWKKIRLLTIAERVKLFLGIRIAPEGKA